MLLFEGHEHDAQSRSLQYPQEAPIADQASDIPIWNPYAPSNIAIRQSGRKKLNPPKTNVRLWSHEGPLVRGQKKRHTRRVQRGGQAYARQPWVLHVFQHVCTLDGV